MMEQILFIQSIPAFIVLSVIALIVFIQYPFFSLRKIFLGLRTLSGFMEPESKPNQIPVYSAFLMLLSTGAGFLGIYFVIHILKHKPGSLLWMGLLLPLISYLFRSESLITSKLHDKEGAYNYKKIAKKIFHFEALYYLQSSLSLFTKVLSSLILPLLILVGIFTAWRSYSLINSSAVFEKSLEVKNFIAPAGLEHKADYSIWLFFIFLILLVSVLFFVKKNLSRVRAASIYYQLGIGLLAILIFSSLIGNFSITISSFSYLVKSAFLSSSSGSSFSSGLSLSLLFIFLFKFVLILESSTGLSSALTPHINISTRGRFGIAAMLIPMGVYLFWLLPLALYFLNQSNTASFAFIQDVSYLKLLELDKLWLASLFKLSVSSPIYIFAVFYFLASGTFLLGLHFISLMLGDNKKLSQKIVLSLFVLLLIFLVVIYISTNQTSFVSRVELKLYYQNLFSLVWLILEKVFLVYMILAAFLFLMFSPLVIYFTRAIQKDTNDYVNNPENSYPFFTTLYILLLAVLPKNLMSKLVGLFAFLPLPRFLMIPVLKVFTKMYKIDMDEAELELKDYKSLNKFFTRSLKTGARIIDHEEKSLVSPVDGRILIYGKIEKGILLQAKGTDYSLKELIGDNDYNQYFDGGLFCTLYLSPQDYHRIHVPCDCSVESYYYVPGKLYPVNNFAVKMIFGLFPKNERMISFLQTAYGKIAMVKVGATSVGKIRVRYLEKFRTNKFIRKEKELHYLEEKVSYKKGEEIGRFEMGSTVILLFEKNTCNFFDLEKGSKIKLGQALAYFIDK